MRRLGGPDVFPQPRDVNSPNEQKRQRNGRVGGKELDAATSLDAAAAMPKAPKRHGDNG